MIAISGRRLVSLVAMLGALLAIPAAAPAAQPDLLWTAPVDEIGGEAAGRLVFPSGVAADPTSGHVFVADKFNRRISEFDVWGRFVKSWGWGVADGTAELQTCGPGASPPSETCERGLLGPGAGEMAVPWGLAIDAAGAVYADELFGDPSAFGTENFRIQKFSSDGEFLWMAGGEVNKTTGANYCSAEDIEAGDVCGAGIPGGGPGVFGYTPPGAAGGKIAIGEDGTIFVGDVERIQEFSPDGEFQGSIPVPGEIVSSLAIDSADLLYVTYGMGSTSLAKDNVRVISRAGVVFPTVYEVQDPTRLAISRGETLFVAANPENGPDRILEFGLDGSVLIPSTAEEEAGQLFNAAGTIGGIAVNTGTVCGIDGEDLYVSARSGTDTAVLRAYGPPPDPLACPPPAAAPSIVDQYVERVSADSARIGARINPHFWSDTEFYVEYGSSPCATGGCTSKLPLGQGIGLTQKSVNAAVTSPYILLSGLSASTTYYYRIVAASSGGGPVRGEGGSESIDGSEGTLRTTRPARAQVQDDCANAAFRRASAARLPDCRSHEMVSPVDKNAADIVVAGGNKEPNAYDQADVAGSKLTFSSFRAFGDSQSSPFTSQYISVRTPNGWATHGISPPRDHNIVETIDLVDSQYEFFSPDLCSAWLVHEADNLLAPGAAQGYANIYSRANCAPNADTYSAVTTVAPPHGFFRFPPPELQGVSADGSHVVYRAKDSLTDDAPDLGPEKPLVYEEVGSVLRLVCVLPSGQATKNGCSTGTAAQGLSNGRHHALAHAVSEDGARIYWTDSPRGPGSIYLRVKGKNPTVPVSNPLSTAPAQYLDATPDGAGALFTFTSGPLQGDLYRFDASSTSRSLIAKKVLGIFGASTDLSRMYLVSQEALADGATAGSANLYFYDEDAGSPFRFVSVVTNRDAFAGNAVDLSPVNLSPLQHTAQVTSDGLAAVFTSTASLTGFDNHDIDSGEPVMEVFVYRAQSDELLCVSCLATGARPGGRQLSTGSWVAARIKTSERQLYQPRVISENGKRVFFESYDPLVPEDNNGNQDVYQWEAEGEGSCQSQAPNFNAAAGGCVDLISSGTGHSRAAFVDASASGNDVFISTDVSLVNQDDGFVDIYDARIGGGFESPSMPAPCQGEACQAESPSLPVPAPGSSVFQGQGNVKKPAGRKCRKGERHRKKKKCGQRSGRGRAGKKGGRR